MVGPVAPGESDRWCLSLELKGAKVRLGGLGLATRGWEVLGGSTPLFLH